MTYFTTKVVPEAGSPGKAVAVTSANMFAGKVSSLFTAHVAPGKHPGSTRPKLSLQAFESSLVGTLPVYSVWYACKCNGAQL